MSGDDAATEAVGRRDRRFVFGEVAELYDAARPRYPAELFDELVRLGALGASSTVLEVGAGTGQATVDLAARAASVTAIEPNEAMLAVAERRVGTLPGVTLARAAFEEWIAPEASYDLIAAAQSWHWIAPDPGYPKAARLLTDGGWLTVFWNLPVDRGPAADGIDEVYARYSPQRGTISRWGGQDSSGTGEVERYGGQLAASQHFGDVAERRLPWQRTYTTDGYLDLVRTHSDYRLLDEEARGPFLDALRQVLDDHGGTITVGFVTQLYAAPRR